MFPTSNSNNNNNNIRQGNGNSSSRASTAVAPGQLPKKRRRRRRDGEEDEPVLRTTCDNCTSAKVKCNGASPCVRCTNKSINCEYTYKKRCGPKRRKGTGVDAVGGNARGSASDSEGLLAPYARSRARDGNGAFEDALASVSVILNKDESDCVRVFMQNVNMFMPLTTLETVTLAATPATGNGFGGRGAAPGQRQNEEEVDQLRHARKAVLHGAIAVGAEFLDKEEASQSHAQIARQEIKECFDAAEPELVGAYLILALYWTHQMDSTKIARYIGLAHQSNGIIAKPPPELVASLTFISVILYDAKVIPNVGCRVDPPSNLAASSASRLSSVASQERVLKILSFVLLAIHNRASPPRRGGADATSTGAWDPNVLVRHLDHAKLLLDNASGPNDMALCMVVVLQAYFLLLRDNRHNAVLITEPIADLVADNPLVLHLPIVWTAVDCVKTLLENTNRMIAAERLESAMEPITARVVFASQESVVGRELMSVFEKERGGGGDPARGVAGAGPHTADNILVRQNRVHTSSLNVTAGDILRPRSSQGDLLAIEPSPAPGRRSGPPPSSSSLSLGRSQSADRATEAMPGRSGGGGGRGLGSLSGALSPSLLSAAMASSVDSALRASSAPTSRVGSLSRTPGGLPCAFNRPQHQASLLQLGISGYGPDFISGAGEVPIQIPGIVPLSNVGDSPGPAITEDEVEVEVGMGQAGAGGGGGRAAEIDEEMLEGIDPRELSGARDLLAKHVQQSFNPNENTLEQVDRTLAKLTVSQAEEGRPTLGQRVNSIDLEATAEMLACNPTFIS